MILQPMKRKHLKLLADNHGVDWKWKSKARIRRDIQLAMGIHPIRSLADLKTCIGVRDVEMIDRHGSCTVILHHKWWGFPFTRANRTTLMHFGNNKFPANVTFAAKTTVDSPSWRVSVAMLIVGAIMGLLF